MRSHRNALNPIFNLGELPAVPNPSIPPPRSRTLFPQRAAAVRIPAAQPHPLLHLPGEGKRGRGEAGMFRRDIRVSDAKRGRVPCRSKEHTASTLPKRRTPHHSVRGSGRAADGNRTRVSGLGSVRSTIELQPHLFQCIAPACRGRNVLRLFVRRRRG